MGVEGIIQCHLGGMLEGLLPFLLGKQWQLHSLDTTWNLPLLVCACEEEAEHRPEEALGLCYLCTVPEVLLEGDATSSWPPSSMQNPTE